MAIPILTLLLLAAPGYPITPVPFTSVHLRDRFWAPKIEINREASIPFAFQKCEETGRIDNFVRAGKALRHESLENRKPPIFPFDDSDVYKVIEGASFSMSSHPDPKLDAYVDGVIAKIASAQEPDGYLYTARTIDPEHPHAWSGKERWVNEEEQSHELYDLGHLYEAAVAHHRATGKRNLLDIAIRSADLLDRTFGPGKRKIWPGHEVVEMGLAKLGVETRNPRYIQLAKFFLDSRGGSGEYWQAQAPVTEQREAVGHAVRAAYLYSGMADIASLTGDKEYTKAIDAIWHDVVDTKLYVTGGIGQTGGGEAFGAAYDLPNMSAYCETCAAVGNDFWNQRLFQLHGDAKYVDVFERTLYNGLISGVSLDGKGFFYPNPLESRGQHERQPWFDCPCCPGNIVRFLPSLPGSFYATQGNSVYVNLYAANDADLKVGGTAVRLSQDTDYPWSGAIRLHVAPVKPTAFAVRLRIPGWAREQAVPSDLYHFRSPIRDQISLTVNGKPQSLNLDKGFAVIQRTWKKGDTIALNLPMPVRAMVANDKVKEDAGKVAFQRGPLVYCAETADNGPTVRNLLVDPSQPFSSAPSSVLGGIIEVTGPAKVVYASGPQPTTLKLIPYYAWANRGRGSMEVWFPETLALARPVTMPTLAGRATVTASPGVKGLEGIHDGEDPKSSVDESDFAHWWPRKGEVAWAQLTFEKPERVSGSDLYWFDDEGIGECRIPASWRLLYLDGTEWRPVESEGTLGIAKDRYNTVRFRPVTTTALRVEFQMQPNWSSGIKEWKISTP